MATSADALPRTSRRAYIDWARGVAVLVMIEAHATDAWTRSADRSSPLFGYLGVLAGLAAPLFLWLAGVGLAMSAEQRLSRGESRRTAAEAIIARGAEIFILAFLFRLQAFVVSPGSWAVTLFRVDILNVMGPAIAVAGIIWGLSRGPRTAAIACGLAATALAMSTPLVRQAAWVSSLPTWFQWYLRPSGDNTTFTLLPWSGFVFAGAAAGALLATVSGGESERKGMTALGIAGATTIVLGLGAAELPTIYRASSFWTSSPTYFAIRVGIVMLGLAALYSLSSVAAHARAPFRILERFGRNSLFVYWIHVELVYGYATWIIHGRLPLWAALCCYVCFAAAMHAAILVRDRLVTYWSANGLLKPSSSTAAPARL